MHGGGAAERRLTDRKQGAAFGGPSKVHSHDRCVAAASAGVAALLPAKHTRAHP